MRRELEDALTASRDLPREELPRLLGDLEEIRATAMGRLAAAPTPAEPDRLLSIAEAAAMLGVSKDYLYHHADEYPFTRRMGRRLLFSRNGIEKYMKMAKVA